MRRRSDGDFRVVGIGASAGGLEALERLLRAVPPDAPLAFLVVQHLDPRHRSRLSEILSRATSMPVEEAADGMRVEGGHVYTIPSNSSMVVEDGHVRLRPREGEAGHVSPIDDLFRSVARAEKRRAVGVVLSGTSSDGAAGVRAIKAGGGATLAQDAASARYFDLPRAAIDTGAVDFVLPPEDIARYLARLAREPRAHPPVEEAEATLLADQGESLAALFGDLKRAFGVDFGKYKRATVSRRIQRRMARHGAETLEEYVRLVRAEPEELRRLYQEMFIGVTRFFREPKTFEALRRKVFPPILRKRDTDAPVRIWVPGCSTGEEVYSLAIAFLEHLGSQAGTVPIQIFGSDIDEEAIRTARAGRYPASVAHDIGPRRLGRFFLKKHDGYQVNKTLRDLCVFARHDVLRDPPFSRLDLLSCRNLLIYLGPGLQQRLVPLFHYALRPDRFLLLGSAETIGGHGDLFDLVDARARIYAKKPGVVVPRLESPAEVAAITTHGASPGNEAQGERSDLDRHRNAADLILLNEYAPAAVLVNGDMEILHFRGRTGPYLEPAPGVASLNLLKMAREGLLGGLKKTFETARRKGVPAWATALHVESQEGERVVDVRVLPVRTPVSEQRTYLVLFEETSGPAKAAEARGRRGRHEPGKEAKERVDQLRQELAATKAYLQSTIESREAGIEELRSTNEELLSTNEELQSTTEELETSNEELQSANEELTTLNEELQRRNIEIGRAHEDILNLLASIRTSLVIVDEGLLIRRFTPFAENVLGLHASHVGRPLGELRLRVDIPDLEERLRDVVHGGPPVDQEIQDHEGRWQSLRIRPFVTAEEKVEGAVLALTDVHAVKQTEERFRVALLAAPITVFTQDQDLRYTWVHNPTDPWTDTDILGKTDRDILGSEDAETLTALKRRVLRTRAGVRKTVPLAVHGEARWYDLVVEPMAEPNGRTVGVTCAAWDVTPQEEARQQARQLAVVEERNRLAREMHDGLSQDLVAILLQLEADEVTLTDDPAAAMEIVRGTRDRLREVLESARRALRALRPRLLEDTELTEALERLVAEAAEHTTASVRLRVRGTVRRLPADVEENLFRVAQEALLNATRHGAARRIVVELAFAKDSAGLQVRDDGRGFDRPTVRSDGYGFATMTERSARMGGEITIDGTPGRGTRVKVRVPAPAPKGRS